MEDRKEQQNGSWLSVPQFGDWDLKTGQVPDYSLDFSKIRENRKQNKREASRASIGNEEDLVPSSDSHVVPPEDHHSTPLPPTRRSIFSCFNCFARV